MIRRFAPLVALVAVLSTLSVDLRAADPAKIMGLWTLRSDASDTSSLKLKSRNMGVVWKQGEPSAVFDGRQAVVEIPDHAAHHFGTGDFSIALWALTAESLEDGLGDLVSKFDGARRRGFHLGFMDNVGVTDSAANARQLQFGIDNGHIETDWTDRGRPGDAMLIFTMAAYDGSLYAGTCESSKEAAGHVFRYQGGNSWSDCGSPDRSNSVAALAVHQGQLYAGTAQYRLKGSSLAESENTHAGGRIFRYAGGMKWIECGQLPDVAAVHGLVVFRDQLYASSTYAPSGLFRYAGGTKWESCGSPGGKRVEALTVYNGGLYATSYDGGFVFRYDGQSWTDCGKLGDNTQTYSFAVLGGKLYVGTWPSGRVYRYEADQKWTDVGRLGQELEVMGMAVYNGKLYAGTLPLAEVYRYDGGEIWTKTGRVDHTPDVKYRRAWTMVVYRGELFCGTLPSGRVHSYEAGKSVTVDRQLSAGWHHVAAIKSGSRLKILVDGKLAAESTAFNQAKYDLSNDQPLTLGFGPHDYFNGRLADVRLYATAISDSDVAKLAAEKR